MLENLNSKTSFKYVIVGAGLSGVSAIEGIRELDKTGTILLVGAESQLPYNRPPLSKKLWSGEEKVMDIFVHDKKFYDTNKVELLLETRVESLDSSEKLIACDDGKSYGFEKLLLATGGQPKKLSILGADLDGVTYYRNLSDYTFLKEKTKPGCKALIIGGGFIGTEIAAALKASNVDVTMIFPGKNLVQRVFPESLARATKDQFTAKGIEILAEDLPTSIEATSTGFLTKTREGKKIDSNVIIVGIGIDPSVDLAQSAGLKIANGIFVDEHLQTSRQDIFSAGDNTNFSYVVLSERKRVEHWDNAVNQGKLAGRNMAGANEVYDYMPFFFSDLFDMGYEAVGEVDARLETSADWQEENKKGIIYYLKDGRVRGVMMCNVWDKVPWARDLIKKGEIFNPLQKNKINLSNIVEHEGLK